MTHGPVDIVLLAFGEPKFDGSVLAELERLADAGIVRVLDAMVVAKSDAGMRISIDLEDLPEEEKARLGFVKLGQGLFDAADEDTVFEGLTPGSAVMGLAVEHIWAVKFRETVEAAGAEVALTERIPATEVDAAFAALGA